MVCKNCGKGFLAKPWDKNGQASTCKRMKCEKIAGIYVRPMTASEMAKKANDNMTPEQKTARGLKGAQAVAKKYGKGHMKDVRAGKKVKLQ